CQGIITFRNKDLSCQRALKMGLGQLRGPSWLTDPPRNCPNQISIVARDGSYVNEFRSRMVVMKNHENSVPSSNKTPRLTRRGKPGLEKRETRGTPGFSPCQRLRATRVIPAREKRPARHRYFDTLRIGILGTVFAPRLFIANCHNLLKALD